MSRTWSRRLRSIPHPLWIGTPGFIRGGVRCVARARFDGRKRLSYLLSLQSCLRCIPPEAGRQFYKTNPPVRFAAVDSRRGSDLQNEDTLAGRRRTVVFTKREAGFPDRSIRSGYSASNVRPRWKSLIPFGEIPVKLESGTIEKRLVRSAWQARPGQAVPPVLPFSLNFVGRRPIPTGRKPAPWSHYPAAAIDSLIAAVSSSCVIAVLTNSSCRAPLHSPIAFQPFCVGTVMRTFTSPFASRTCRITPGIIDRISPRATSFSRTGRRSSRMLCSIFSLPCAVRSRNDMIPILRQWRTESLLYPATGLDLRWPMPPSA